MPYSWNARLKTVADIRNWLCYFDLDAPLVAMGTLVSSSSIYTNICQDSTGQAYGLTESHFHALSYSGAGGHFYMDVGSNDTVEYLGYFNPASVFYHVDPQVKNTGL
ncbi:unnamed protein product [Lasius platythorax]|uniref:DUF1907 domain-containing protein n=1 Tax=Lasius platythorax TaxID=488582 RepID=A0AAV2P5S2_9HYME